MAVNDTKHQSSKSLSKSIESYCFELDDIDWSFWSTAGLMTFEASFYGELKVGKCPQHKPLKRFRNCVEENIAFDIDVSNSELFFDRDESIKMAVYSLSLVTLRMKVEAWF